MKYKRALPLVIILTFLFSIVLVTPTAKAQTNYVANAGFEYDNGIYEYQALYWDGDSSRSVTKYYVGAASGHCGYVEFESAATSYDLNQDLLTPVNTDDVSVLEFYAAVSDDFFTYYPDTYPTLRVTITFTLGWASRTFDLYETWTYCDASNLLWENPDLVIESITFSTYIDEYEEDYSINSYVDEIVLSNDEEPEPTETPAPTPTPVSIGLTDYGTWYLRSDTDTVMGELGYKLRHINSLTATQVNETITQSSISVGFRLWYTDALNETYEATSGTPVGTVSLTETTGSDYLEYIGFWSCPTIQCNAVDHFKLVVYFYIGGIWTAEAAFISPSGSDDIQNYVTIKNCTAAIHYWLHFIPESIISLNFGSSITGDDADSRIDLNTPRADPWSVSYARFQNFDVYGAASTPFTWVVGVNLFWTILFLGGITMIIMKHGSYKMVILLCWILGGSGSLLWAIIPEAGIVVAAIMLAFGMGATLFKIFHR